MALRRGVSDGYAFPVTDEALAPGAGSLKDERTVDLQTQPVAVEVRRNGQVVQHERARGADRRRPAGARLAAALSRVRDAGTTRTPVPPHDRDPPWARAWTLTAAARAALVELIDSLEAARGLAPAAAYALCGVAADLRISEAVDVPYPHVSALLPLDVFER